MLAKQPFSEQHIINTLKNEYNLTVSTLKQIPLGADIDASVYKATTCTNTSYFVKVSRNHNNIASLIQRFLHENGIKEIIAPRITNDNKTTCLINNFTLNVYPFIEGENGFNHSLTNQQWIALGKALHNIHILTLPPSIKNNLKQESYSPQWRQEVKNIYTYIATNPNISHPLAIQLLTILNQKKETILLLIDLADTLADHIKQLSPELVLCHADLHGGNVLIPNNTTLYIIDWDQPILAPKERDLMFIGGGVGNVWNKPDEEKLFYCGYGHTTINYNILTYYRCERIIEDIAIYSNELLFNSTDTNDKTEMLHHFMNLFTPNGVIEIAIKTSKSASYHH